MAADRARSLAIGSLMVVGGALWLLETADVLRLGPVWLAVSFGLAGLGFGFTFLRQPQAWWTAIPAGALLGLASVMAVGELQPDDRGQLSGALFLGLLGLGFLAVAVRSTERWWALIAGGVLVSLALMTATDPFLSGLQATAVLFGGMAVTFALVAHDDARAGRRPWALLPAAALGLMAAAFATDSPDALKLIEYVLPLLVIGCGLVAVSWALRHRQDGGTSDRPARGPDEA